MYFNGGLFPYVSLNHKHLQVIPIDSLLCGKIPIEECVVEAMERAQVPFNKNDLAARHKA